MGGFDWILRWIFEEKRFCGDIITDDDIEAIDFSSIGGKEENAEMEVGVLSLYPEKMRRA